MKNLISAFLLAGVSVQAGAQVLPFNDAGVTMGHQFDAILPGDIEVHFFADPDLSTPVAHRAMAFVSTDPDAQRAGGRMCSERPHPGKAR